MLFLRSISDLLVLATRETGTLAARAFRRCDLDGIR